MKTFSTNEKRRFGKKNKTVLLCSDFNFCLAQQNESLQELKQARL